ncbi:bile acid:sodium symporter family protein [Paenibacillus montanisoli]|uniref:Bile acid:sodium symporter family protein n=1 Tax=Paenibacillus montanisoli TaxID=2081970 RepID=A0A328UB61_9BACL|nr:bile acid:sodium symporter family protein [Paenibacillus montanisoli]RAP77524.1 bile acid:sodium symporter family protein [Paenibacillus montanisoli]
MFLIIPGSLVLGFFFSAHLQRFVHAVPYFFAFVTLTMAIGCGLQQLRAVINRPGVMLWTFVLAHVLSPLIAYGLGCLLFGADSPYVIGLVLFTIIPLGVSTVLWVGMSAGSVPLMMAMVVIDSALSPFVVPTGIHLLFRTDVETDTVAMIGDLLLIIVAPTIVGVALHEWSKGRIQRAVQPIAAPLSKLCFTAVVMLNAAAIAPQAEALRGDLLKVVPAAVAIVGLCYAAGFFGTLHYRNREVLITVSYATGMRNISLGVVLAMGYFSPLTAVPVVLSILIQQPLATLHHYVLQKLKKRSASVGG